MELMRQFLLPSDQKPQRDDYLAEPWQGMEIIPPREMPNSLKATTAWLGTLHALGQPVNLEIVQEPQRVSLRLFAPAEAWPRVMASVRRAFPQADFRPVPAMQNAWDQDVAGCELRLASSPYLPLTMFADAEEHPVDPLCGLCSLSDDLTAGERVLAQILIEPAAGWPPRDALRPRKPEPQPNEPALFIFCAGLLMLSCAAFILTYDPNFLGYLIIGAMAVALLAGVRWYYANSPFPFQIDPVLVEEKMRDVGFVTNIRLMATSPSVSHARFLLGPLVAGFGQFNRGRGNRLEACPLSLPNRSRRPTHRPFWQVEHILSAREIAALWHLPLQAGDVPNLEAVPYRPVHLPHGV